MSKDYYAILGVQRNATLRDIKAAYRSLALEHHPDRVAGFKKRAAEEKFKEIQEAYEILSDFRKHQRYKQELYAGTAGSKAKNYGLFIKHALKYFFDEVLFGSERNEKVLFFSIMFIYTVFIAVQWKWRVVVFFYMILGIIIPYKLIFPNPVLDIPIDRKAVGYKILRWLGWTLLIAILTFNYIALKSLYPAGR